MSEQNKVEKLIEECETPDFCTALIDLGHGPKYDALVAELRRLAQGKVTVTTNEEGDCVAVTRTDAEGKVADVLWERSAQQEQTNERNALRNATVLKDWADSHSINFVNRSYDQYTTRTVSYDALIDLINSATLKPAAPNNSLLIEGFGIHALAQRLRRLCRETGFTTNYDKDKDKFVAGSAATIIDQVLRHLSRNKPAVPEGWKVKIDEVGILIDTPDGEGWFLPYSGMDEIPQDGAQMIRKLVMAVFAAAKDNNNA